MTTVIKKNKLYKDWRFICIILGLTSLAVRSLATEETIENWYSRGVFIGIRQVFDVVTGLLPFALVYLLFLILVFAGVRAAYQFFKARQTWLKKTGIFFLNFVAFTLGILFLFLTLWGFNYGRVPLEDKMGIETSPLTLEDLKMELDSTTKVIRTLREKISPGSDSVLNRTQMPQNLEKTMRTALVNLLNREEYPTPGNVRARILVPKGILLRISTAGVYIPFTGEGHVDAGLHPIQVPFVMAHEMAHGYGFGDEGTCNFLAFLACIQSGDPVLEYIGYFSYWRYVASNYRRYEREKYAAFYQEKVPEGVKNDLRAIYKEMDKYPDVFPAVRDAVYHNYLKAQGIKEGIQNYSRILMLEKGRKAKIGKKLPAPSKQ